MSITVKTKEEIDILREGGMHLAKILERLKGLVVSGLHVKELDTRMLSLVEEINAKPAFLNYTPYGAKRPYPSALCVSINDAVVHGVPSESSYVLEDGDIITLDAGLIYKGLYTDSAITVPVGKINSSTKKLLKVTEGALYAGIDKIKSGNRVGDISKAIEDFVRPYGFGIVEELSGHGVGYKVHEDPYVPNYYMGSKGALLKEGMVLAIEPIINEGGKEIYLDEDGYTYRTKDGKKSAHFEHTVVVTEGGVEILTSL